MGLLDLSFDNLDDPKKQMLLAMAAGLLTPQHNRGLGGFGAALGQAVPMGLNQYAQASMMKQKMGEAAIQKQLHELQLNKAKQEDAYLKARSQGFTPGTSAVPYNDALGSELPQAPIPGSPGGMNWNPAMQVDPFRARMEQAQMAQLGAKQLVHAKEGESVLQYDNESGKLNPLYQAPKAKKYHYQDLGDKIGVIDEDGKKVSEFAKSMSPDAAATDRRGWAGLNQQERHFREGQGKPIWDEQRGAFVTPPASPSGPSVIPVPNLPPAQQKPTEGYMKQISGVENVKSAIDDYMKELRGWTSAKMAKPDEIARISVVYNNAMLQAKEAYNLGVLNGPDYKILTSVLIDPISVKGALTSTEAKERQAKVLKNLMDKIAQGSAKAHGQTISQGVGKRVSFDSLPD